jgi:hypothetical protein
MAIRTPSKRAGLLQLGLGLGAVIVAVMVGFSGMPASADGPDPAPAWTGHHHQNWAGNPPLPAPYGYGPHGYYRRPGSACGTSTVVGAAFGAGVGGLIGSQLSDRPGEAGPTVMGMLVGAVLGGAIGQSADRANGC